jgi:hypothetical protein
MPSYMPQRVFDVAVVNAAKIHIGADYPFDRVGDQIRKRYEHSYPDDLDFILEIEQTSGELLEMMRSEFEDEQIPSSMTQI